MFNTYHHFLEPGSCNLSGLIKNAPVKGIDADPLVKELCEWICYETKGHTVFSCEGHDKPFSDGYVWVEWPSVIPHSRIHHELNAAIASILTPLKMRKQISARATITFDKDYGPSKTILFRFHYKHNDRTFSVRTFNRIIKQVMQDIDALDNPVTPVALDEEVNANVSMYDLGA